VLSLAAICQLLSATFELHIGEADIESDPAGKGGKAVLPTAMILSGS
jgi:hypothetical protein